MTIGTNLCIHIKIIKQHIFTCNFMLIRSIFFSKKRQGRIAVSFFYIPKYLIVGPVFFNYVKHVFDWRRIAHLFRNGITGFTLCNQFFILIIRSIHENIFRIYFKISYRRLINHTHGSFHQTTDILQPIVCLGKFSLM